MKKQELATVLRDRLELGSLKDANRVIDEFAKILSEAMVAGDEVTLPDVGTFKTAMSAGELMLCSGAETYRVEDTMYHILKTADNLEMSEESCSIPCCWKT